MKDGEIFADAVREDEGCMCRRRRLVKWLKGCGNGLEEAAKWVEAFLVFIRDQGEGDEELGERVRRLEVRVERRRGVAMAMGPKDGVIGVVGTRDFGFESTEGCM